MGKPVVMRPEWLTRFERRAGKEIQHPPEAVRPKTRGDCEGGERPCPWVSCQHNLYLDVTEAGGVKLNFPDLEPDQMEHSCALDIADQGGATLDLVGEALSMTRERVRQIQDSVLYNIKVSGVARRHGL